MEIIKLFEIKKRQMVSLQHRICFQAVFPYLGVREVVTLRGERPVSIACYCQVLMCVGGKLCELELG